LHVPAPSVSVSARSLAGRAARAGFVASTCIALGACSLASEALWPSTGSRNPGPNVTRVEIPASPAEQRAAGAAAQQGMSTAVGQRAIQLREEAGRLQSLATGHGQTLQQLRAENIDAAQRYQTLVGQINARLQVGTTPGNPILTGQLGQAQGELDRFSANIGSLSQLSGQVGAAASMGAFLLDSLRNAYAISGAVEEDHRLLAQVEDEVGRTMVSIDRMRTELSEDIARQSSYVSRERSNMTTLGSAVRTGEFYGPGLSARAIGPAAANVRATAPAPAAARPLVTIRYDRPNPAFEQSLYAAATRALEARPQASFEIVGVAATGGGAGDAAMATANARRQAEQVMRALVDMGMPADRVRLQSRSDARATANEVQVFVR